MAEQSTTILSQLTDLLEKLVQVWDDAEWDDSKEEW
jgi:hypothetical protein